jgi:hypothetical protein
MNTIPDAKLHRELAQRQFEGAGSSDHKSYLSPDNCERAKQSRIILHWFKPAYGEP